MVLNKFLDWNTGNKQKTTTTATKTTTKESQTRPVSKYESTFIK